MKEIIRKWLEIKDPKAPDLAPLEEKLDSFMAKYHPATCSICEKQIIAHYGGFYRNALGQVFCSDKCTTQSEYFRLSKRIDELEGNVKKLDGARNLRKKAVINKET